MPRPCADQACINGTRARVSAALGIPELGRQGVHDSSSTATGATT